MPIEILCFVPAVLHVFQITPAWFRYYPVNVCMDMVAGHDFFAVDTRHVCISGNRYPVSWFSADDAFVKQAGGHGGGAAAFFLDGESSLREYIVLYVSCICSVGCVDLPFAKTVYAQNVEDDTGCRVSRLHTPENWRLTSFP